MEKFGSRFISDEDVVSAALYPKVINLFALIRGRNRKTVRNGNSDLHLVFALSGRITNGIKSCTNGEV